ncbi:4-(cytidine 5'-diphospho)-2-C-methyl-D-erythritol kinase [Phragmitibacter flavus]|nr:4-(cytidine 5'-diphospho)-2-C-methyl-D-erythritol kinase [Phragmitibacter flavus]
MTLTLRSPAKINLWLRVLRRRDDGFHDVDTRMCPLDLADEVTLEPSVDGLAKLTCSNPELPVDESNLAMKALRGYEKRSGTTQAWQIHLEKHVPHGAGLGGGSSNAATVLLGLNRLNGGVLSDEDLHEIAAELGSDVPFFLYGRTCDATGRGEVIEPVETFDWELPVVLIKPGFGISTPWAYKNWRDSKELAGVFYGVQTQPWGEMINDLERPVFEKWIWLPTMKNWLLEQEETVAALMSGSGSTMFAVARSEADAAVLAESTRKFCGESTWVQVTRTRK